MEKRALMGTNHYIAREVWSDHYYTTKSDVYAFGVTFAQFLCNSCEDLPTEQIISCVKEMKLPNALYQQAEKIPYLQQVIQLVTKCINNDSAKRPEFDVIVQELHRIYASIEEVKEKKNCIVM